MISIDPALRLALGKDHQAAASQSMLSRLENEVLGNAMGLDALDGALARCTDTLLQRKNKQRLIIDLDSTEDPAHGKQEGVACNGHFAKNCFHPLFCCTSDGDCLGARRDRAMFTQQMVLWILSGALWSVTALGSSFFGCVAMLPLLTPRSMSITKISGSRISFDYRPIES
jgi:hypothetical protein